MKTARQGLALARFARAKVVAASSVGRFVWTLVAFCVSCAADSVDLDHSASMPDGKSGSGSVANGTGGGAPPVGGTGAGGTGSAGDTTLHGGGGQVSMPSLDYDGGGGSRVDGGTGVIIDPDSGLPEPISWAPIEASQIGMQVMVATGFSLAEGVLWDPCRGTLLFADVDNAIIHELTPPDQVGTFRADSNWSNGMVFDAQGRLNMAEMGAGSRSGRITRMDRAGKLEIVVDKDPAGDTFHTVDDLIVRSDGTIYFTDPTFPHGGTLTVGLAPTPIYRFSADGSQLVKEGETLGPNGVVLSPDEKTLYVASHGDGLVMRFDVAADGSLTETTPLIDGLTNPDSMCVDAAGNVYLGIYEGLLVLRPDGTRVTTLPVYSSATHGVTNCGFGGEDGKTLYFSSWATIWRVDNMPIPGLDWELSQNMPCD